MIPLLLALAAVPDAAQLLAGRMWAEVQRTQWEAPYTRREGCQSVPPHKDLRGGLFDYQYVCTGSAAGVTVESMYYPVERGILLQRLDIRLTAPYAGQSAAVEAVLRARLIRHYGPGTVPGNLFEIGASLPRPGLSWRAGEITLFLHANRNHVAPKGLREGVQLIAVRREVLERRRLEADYARSLTPPIPQPGGMTEPQARRALFAALSESREGHPERRAEALLTADDLAVRLGALLVTPRGEEIAGAAPVRRRLAAYGVRYRGIGHYSGALEYNRGLLLRAWKQFPATSAGQRAFLRLQDVACAVPVTSGCRPPGCYRDVIRQLEQFLRDYPESGLRIQAFYRLGVAHETWWSLSQAQPGDITAEGARVRPAEAESARRRAIEIYEDLQRLAPVSAEAGTARLRLPRLRLRLDTAERRFFCFSC